MSAASVEMSERGSLYALEQMDRQIVGDEYNEEAQFRGTKSSKSC